MINSDGKRGSEIRLSNSSVSSDEEDLKSLKWPQYLAGFTAALGALSAGIVLGWTSPAGTDGIALVEEYGFNISTLEFSWIGSLATLGAAVICVPSGILTDVLGRKTAMLLTVIPFTVGWALIILASSVSMFYVGRFITGFSGGAFCVTVPMYNTEIADKEIRGRLGSYFELFLCIGVLFVYLLGILVNIRTLCVISAAMPLIFFCIFVFMPETPVYYMQKGNEPAARASLKWLRGSHYNIEHELKAIKNSSTTSVSTSISFTTAICSRIAVKSVTIAFGLLLFQEVSGVDAILFYSSTIFDKSGNDMDPQLSSFIMAAIQVIAVLIGTMTIDKLGRRISLMTSLFAMFSSYLVLGVYFQLDLDGYNVDSVRWLPLLSLCIYVMFFAFGLGPIPWMMVGEILSPQIKGLVGSTACFLNWIIAFVITRYFSDLNSALNYNGTFYLFAVFCAAGFVFVFFLVPETKNKTLEEIQIELGVRK